LRASRESDPVSRAIYTNPPKKFHSIFFRENSFVNAVFFFFLFFWLMQFKKKEVLIWKKKTKQQLKKKEKNV